MSRFSGEYCLSLPKFPKVCIIVKLANRGKRKHPDEMSELEKLRSEVKILKAEKERAEMEASLKNFSV